MRNKFFVTHMTAPLPPWETLVQLLHWRAHQHGEQQAVTFLREGEIEAESWNYAELDKRARAVAASLQARGIGGQRVLLLYPSGLEFVAGFLGCLYAGAVAVPVALPHWKRNFHRLEGVVANAAPSLVLTTAETLARLQPLLPGTCLANLPWLATNTDALPPADNWQEPRIDGDTLAFLQFTSGSTAQPKGVMVCHRNLLANHRMLQEAFDQRQGAVWVIWLPLFHDMGLIGNLLQSFYVGGHSVLMPPEAFLVKPVRWLRAISHYRAHTSGGPNFAYDLCVRKITSEQRAELDLSKWVSAFNGAEPVRAETLSLFQEHFAPCGFQPRMHLPCYGLAEATLFVSGVPASESPRMLRVCAASLEEGRIESPASGNSERTLVSCGPTWGDGRFCIVHPETHELCAPETVGEIWLGGSHVAGGYWQQAEETTRTFGARIRDSGEGPFLRTGDLGFVHDGELFVTGRCKDLIIIAGRNHYPSDIEKSVEESHPAVRRAGCAAFSVVDDGEERLVVAAEIERTALHQLVPREVEGAIRRTIAEEHSITPRAIALLSPGALPKTSSGKVQRSTCRQAFLQRSLATITNS